MHSSQSDGYRHPAGLGVLFFTELWERFSYYGMRALLVLFMVAQIEQGGLGLDDATATAIYGLYTAAIYFAALPGGWLGDSYLGPKQAVWYGGIVIMSGHFTLAIPMDWTFFPGLALVVIGTGLLKPNVSAMVGHLYKREGLQARRDGGFVLFYMGINIGAALGPLVCSALGESAYGWHAGFAAAGVGMAVGLLWYRLGARSLAEMPTPNPRSGRQKRTLEWLTVGAAVLAAGWLFYLSPPATVLILHAGNVLLVVFVLYLLYLLLFSGLGVSARRRVLGLAMLCLASAIFWSGFEQAGSSLNLFAERHTDRDFLNWEIPTGWFQSLNPLFVIILAPFFSMLWPALARRHLDPQTPVKFALALFIMALGFGIMVLAARSVALSGATVAATWLLSTYFVHTVAELMLSPVGLSAISRYAPSGLTGRMMGLWFMTAALGNLLAGIFASVAGAGATLDMSSLFTQIVFIGVSCGVLMLLLSPWLRRLLASN